MSVGGVLGGLFNAIVAPALFNNVVEYPVVLVASVATLPLAAFGRRKAAFALGAMLLVGSWTWMVFSHDPSMSTTFFAALVPVVLAGIFWRPAVLRFGVPVTFVVLWVAVSQHSREVLFEDRGYFGVSTVVHDTQNNVHLLYHGTTNHGGQSQNPKYSRWMVPYHYPGSPIGQAWKSVTARKQNFEVAALGLGSGGLACMAAPGEHVVFYEIDPVVQTLATDPSLFTFLRDCPADIVMGDGRLMVAAEPAGRFGLMVVDVFGSDALPVHLFTREAIEVYAQKMTPDGLIVFHISSRFVDMTPMLAAIADQMGWQWRVQNHVPNPLPGVPLEPTRGFVMAPTVEALGGLATDPRWAAPPARVDVWTDQRADLFSVMTF
ncbi:MAG: fused MFS/spermidine synthase [bacterium]